MCAVRLAAPAGAGAALLVETVALSLVAPLLFVLAAVVSFQRPAGPKESVARGSVESIPLLAAPYFRPPARPTEVAALERAVPLHSAAIVTAARFPRAERPIEVVWEHGSGRAIQLTRSASIPSMGLARAPAKAVHRTDPASGESGRGNAWVARQIREPRHAHRLPGERQLLPRQSGQQLPAQKRTEPFRTVEEASWSGERTRAPRGLASSRRWREGVRRRRGSAGVFEVAFDARFSRSWKHWLREF